MKIKGSLAVLAACLPLLANAANGYDFKALDYNRELYVSTEAYDINDAGVIAGHRFAWVDTPNYDNYGYAYGQLVTWGPDGASSILQKPEGYSYGDPHSMSISNSGLVVAQYDAWSDTFNQNEARTAAWYQGEKTEFGRTGSLGSGRVILDNSGQVVYEPYAYGTTCSFCVNGVAATNDNGTSVVYGYGPGDLYGPGARLAYAREQPDGSFVKYSLPASYEEMRVNALNNQNVAVGASVTDVVYTWRKQTPAVWGADGSFTALSKGQNYSGYATDINDQGLVVGLVLPTGIYEESLGVMWQGGELIYLDTFLEASLLDAGWHVRSAAAVNNLGQIVGVATDRRGTQAAFVLSPTSMPSIPEPSSAALFGLGLLIGVAGLRRRGQGGKPCMA